MTPQNPTGHDDENEVLLRPVIADDGGRTYHSTFTQSGDPRYKVLLAELPAMIPVIFLPGIMGTNLKHRKTGDAVWRPPNVGLSVADILGVVRALMTWPRYGTKRRQQLLKGEDLVVDDRGPVDVGQSGLPPKVARQRGWGTVSRMSYNPIMAVLQQRLNHIVELGQPQDWWRDVGARAPADYGEELGGNEALQPDELLHASRYQYDVWCCGYNWLQSNRDSGADLKAYIEDTVIAHYRNQEEFADQAERMRVILVTHSMGGLVTRALTGLIDDGRVLGVVHGVQPATGAPAIYHHMRCGYEGAVRFILGRNAAQVTAVCANSAGALELVPSFDHRGGQPWLTVRDADAARTPRLRLPATGNPYQEIYKSAEWYGLVPRQNEKYLNLSRNETADSDRGLRSSFNDLIEDVENFHREFAENYHPRTYAHYGADTCKTMHSWRDIVWQGNADPLTAPGAVPEDDGRGSYRSRRQPDAPVLTAVRGAGDGTVCDHSGAAPGRAGKKAGVQASFRHGADGQGPYNRSHPGYGHQESYLDKGAGRTEWAALYSIVRIAQRADWHPEDA